MNIREYLKQSSIYNVLATESLVSENFRNKLSKISKVILSILVLILILFYFTQHSIKFTNFKNFIVIHDLINRTVGLIMFNVGIYIYSSIASFYLASEYYFEKITQNKYSKDELYTFSAGRILYTGRKTDILHGFFASKIGRLILIRLGINTKDINFFYNSENITTDENVPVVDGQILKLKDIAKYLYNTKPNFVKFLNDRGISDKELFGTIEWVIYEIETKEYQSQWWRPEILSTKKRIASDWSFGKTFLLERYGRNLMNDSEVNSEAISFESRVTEISQIENALSKSTAANAMLVGEPGQEKMQVIWSLCRNIKNNTISPALQKKKPILLMANILISECGSKDLLENQVSKILNEVIRAGNVILVIENFTELFKHAENIGSNFLDLINPFLSSSSIQVVAIVNSIDFHQYFENNKLLSNNIETILVRPLTADEVIKIVYAAALESEKNYKIYFTFQAVQEFANSASYYFPNGVTSDIAINLLNEISPWSKRNGYKIIGKDEVLEYIEQKTNIPTSGKISAKEKEKLLDLENQIGKRVVGQKDAIVAISNSLRRARTGVRNPNKPIGSFLFLGPTGVGKTETAKALAYVFFGSEENMMRLDMSEYQTDDSMERLIGSFSTGKPGVFSSMIREKQYGVILLDEFEKTHKDVLNLFLQILDEGFFSDTSGQKVNTRNIIFIATSNAGANTIFEMVNAGKNPKEAQDEIIDEIVKNGLFKPELINRFDATIIYKPLESDDLKQIAKIMLTKVASRMVEKGLTLNISDELIDYIVKNGSNKAFGARPMNRFIQETIEGTIANLILKGEAISGKTISFVVNNNNLVTEIS